MYKGITELKETFANEVSANDYIPIYQKRTLQVMKIKVSELMDALIRLSGADAVVQPTAADPVDESPVEAEIKKPAKTGRGKNKDKESV